MLTKKKNDLLPFEKGMGDYESLIACLIALDSIVKTSMVFPRITFKVARKNNFLVVENLWMHGNVDSQPRLRNEAGAQINVSWLIKTVEAIAIYHDLIPIIIDSGFNSELIIRSSRHSMSKGDSIFDYVRIRHPDTYASLEFLSDVRGKKIYAPKEIIFEWLNINHQSPNSQKRVLLLNRPNSGRRD